MVFRYTVASSGPAWTVAINQVLVPSIDFVHSRPGNGGEGNFGATVGAGAMLLAEALGPLVCAGGAREEGAGDGAGEPWPEEYGLAGLSGREEYASLLGFDACWEGAD